MRKKIILTIIILLLLQVCKKENPFERGAESKEALVDGLLSALSNNDHDRIRSYMVRKYEYVNAIHLHTPEAQGSEGNDYWDTFIIRKRDLLTSGLISKFKGKQCKARIIGPEKKKEKHGPVTFYRQIPVQFTCQDKDKVYLDDDNSTFGVVVEKYGTYKLLNIFND